jgi:predicted amidohydrolase YtcJ
MDQYAANILILQETLSLMTSRRTHIETIVVVLLFAVTVSRAQVPKDAKNGADTIVLHGRIYTLNAKQPWAQALAIRADRIVAVGDDAAITKFRSAGTKVIDAGGQLVLPGFVDCHIHFIDGSLSLGRVNLEGAKDVAEIQQRLRDYAAKHPGTDWLLGRGWDYAMFGPAALPDKKYLDELFPDRPVFLEGYDGHTYWANSKTLAIAGITRDTPDPSNGIITRDPATHEATGALKEAAHEMVGKFVPTPTRAEKLAALRTGIKWANENGLTRVHSAGGDFPELELYDELRRHGDLTLRFYIAYFMDPPEMRPQDVEAIENARKKYHDAWIDTDAVKFMVDGVIESHTAAMIEPYSDDPSLKGKLFWDPAKYQTATAELDKRGLQLFTHAIGELGVRTALDAYRHAEEVNHTNDRRPRIEHIETVTAADIPRFGKLGVIASMQPLHSYPDADTLDVWARNAGPDRASRAWSWKSIADAGGRYCFGSDWPVVTLNPWYGLQTAVTRQTREGKPEAGFVPSQRLSVAKAVEGYTMDAAFAGRRERTEGSLEKGKLADLIIVSQNIFEIDPHKISETKVRTTIVGGQVVYQSDAK